MRRIVPLVALTVAAVLVAGGVAFARGRGDGSGASVCPGGGKGPRGAGCWGGDPERMQERLRERLKEAGMSAEQLAEIAQLREAWREETAPIREQLREKMQELRAQWAQWKETREKSPAAEALLAEVRELRQELCRKGEAFRDQMLGVLTPEQREALRGGEERGPRPRAGRMGRWHGQNVSDNSR